VAHRVEVRMFQRRSKPGPNLRRQVGGLGRWVWLTERNVGITMSNQRNSSFLRRLSALIIFGAWFTCGQANAQARFANGSVIRTGLRPGENSGVFADGRGLTFAPVLR
jgi:hypothetical protein